MTPKRYSSAWLLAAAFALAGCENALLHDPAPAPASIGVNFSLTSAAMGGAGAAYDKANSVRVAVFRASSFAGLAQNFADDFTPINALHSSQAAFAPQAETRVQIELELENEVEPLIVVGALMQGSNPLFAGMAAITATRGQTTSTPVELIPIPDALVVSSVPALTALGDTARIRAAVLFATGDTITDRQLTFHSSSPQVATVDGSGRVLAVGEGQAQITVASEDQYFSLNQVVNVVVNAVVTTIEITPSPATVNVGASVALTAQARDRRNNVLPNRVFAWSSSAPGIASVNATTGVVTGVEEGTATITVSSGTVQNTVDVTVRRIDSRVSGRVTNAVSGAAVAGATVTATFGSTVTASALTDAQGNYSLTVLSGRTYSIAVEASGFAPETANLLALNEQHTLNFQLSPNTARLTGRVVNAVNGAAIPGATVAAFVGSGLVASAVTDAAGNYALDLLAGQAHLISVTAQGFIRGDFEITAGASQTLNVSLSPILAEGEVRIVLTWGQNPGDLDSHLFGPLPDSENRFHVYYASRGSLTSPPFAFLDVDQLQGFGPETITIGQVIEGRYLYAVHHFSGLESIATSGALVRVFRGSEMVAEFRPPNQPGITWNVFALEGDVITPIQTMSPAGPSGSEIGAPRPAFNRQLQFQLTEAQRLIMEAAQKYQKQQR